MIQSDAGERSLEHLSTLHETLRYERPLRDAILLLLTFTAGWTDALTYVGLGHVFASFMSGNFLFLGLSAVHGERGLLLRACVALGSFAIGAFLGALVLRKGLACRTRHAWLGMLARYFAVEAAALLAFGIVWLCTGDPPTPSALQIGLLALAAVTMGALGIAVGELELPGISANAVTGTFLQVPKHLAERVAGKQPTHPLKGHILFALCVTYVMAAIAVTVTHAWAGRVFVPAAAFLVVVVVLLGARR